ncbi:MAG TPA: protocatechuate 3,4-dioxygenase [Vicinamibacteria bacterium]|nr:protocatechuate 3,4-dioxygenase [Vicinamibacteria bacterium]
MSNVLFGGRRGRGAWVAVLSLATAGVAVAQRARPERPATMSWQATLVPPGEPGDALVVSGTVFAADGTTPVPGVVVYAYQADARGLYTNDGRPGVPRLHGWMRTDDRGRYEFSTIRPAAYPGQTVAAHIHMSVAAGGRERTIDDVRFDEDPLLTASMRQRMVTEGPFATLCRAERDASGARRCTRNVRLAP